MVLCSPNRAPTLPESPFGRPSPKSGVTRPQLSSAQNTPSPPRRPRRRPSNSADVENLDPDLINPSSRYPRSPTSPAAQSTPPSERRSFQGDHHRHRYMVHSGQQQHPRPSPKSQSSQSPGQHCSPSAARGSPRKPPAQRVPPVTRSPHHPNLQHLGAPTNAHYSPHYGSPANKPSVSRRKPPPPAASVDVAMSNHLSRTLTPESVSPVTPAQKDGIFENSPRSSICSIVQHGSHKSRTPSPSPSPRSGGLVKKIGSVLSAPFRSSTSRRGSDASDAGRLGQAPSQSPGGPPDSPTKPLAKASHHHSGARELAAILSSEGPKANNVREHLPRMPSANGSPGHNPMSQPGDRCLTPSQLIVRDARLRESIVVPQEPERVLRVVNGCATTSTQATTDTQRPDVRDVLGERHSSSLQPTPSFSTSTSTHIPTSICTKCHELERKLQAEQNRARVLEQLVEDQMIRLDQFKNWSTSKINTLEHSIKAHDGMLQDLERTQYEAKSNPDLKSTYLIALQKDFVDLHSRVVSLETSGRPKSPTQSNGRVLSSAYMKRLTDESSSSTADHHSSISPSPQLTTGSSHASDLRPVPLSPLPLRSPPSSHILHTYEDDQPTSQPASVLPHSSCPATVSTSPIPPDLADLERSYRVDLTTPKRTTWQASSPANLAAKLAPQSPPTPKGPRTTPGSPNSRSPRPRYTTALGAKAASPLSFSTHSPAAAFKRGSVDPIAVDRMKITGRTTPGQPSSSYTVPNTPTHHRAWQPLDLTKNAVNGGHTKRFSVIVNRTPTTFNSPLVPGSTKKPVGDLIRMFDKQT